MLKWTKEKSRNVDLKLDKRTQAISHDVVLDEKVTNLGTLVMKIDLDFVVAVVFFVEGCKFNISLSKVVVLTEVHVADFDVQVVVNCGERKVVEGIIFPVGLVTTILGDG